MSKKIQQYHVIKLESSRLKEFGYKIDLTYEMALVNGEIISLADSELLRILRRIKGLSDSAAIIQELQDQKRKLHTKRNSEFLRRKINELNVKLEEILFAPELIVVHFENKKHYRSIINNGGFSINGKTYVPLLAGAGMLRRASVMFIELSMRDAVSEKLDGGRNKSAPVNPAKFSSYYSLASSTSHSVTFPSICVIPDLMIKTIRTVDFGTYSGKKWESPKSEEKTTEIECNAFDGQGIVSPKMAKTWASDLDLDYTPSTFICRSLYLKGMLCVFDFHKFSNEVAKKNIIIDIYGNEVDVDDVECIISESMLKLWSSYESTEDYLKNVDNSWFGFGISGFAPKELKSFARSSYQFIQVLGGLNSDDVDNLCEPTLKWIRDVFGGDYDAVLSYLLGGVDYSDGWFSRLDPSLQAIILSRETMKDEYFINYLNHSISKKKKDSKLGRLIFNGNYSTMIADPYAQTAHAFGMGVFPLLQEGEHYSKFWNDRGIKETIGIRSPITHESEIVQMKYRNDVAVRNWYEYINAGVIYPPFGVTMDFALHADGDTDGDLVCTIHHPSFLKGRRGGNPITYDKKKAPKEFIESGHCESILKSQELSFGTKIGFITNAASSTYAMIENFPQGSPERTELEERLKFYRLSQGTEIDKTKLGISDNPFPEHFVKYQKSSDVWGKEELDWMNKIVVEKRPLFMRFLYSDYMRKYNKEILIYNSISETKWSIKFQDLLLLQDRDEEQQKLVERYKKRSFFIANNSIMNYLSLHMEKKIKEIGNIKRDKVSSFDFNVYLSKKERPLQRDIDKFDILSREYRSLKKAMKNNYSDTRDIYQFVEQIASYIKKKAYATITSSSEEMGNIAVWFAYKESKDKSFAKGFCWTTFGKEVVENMLRNRNIKFVRVPQKSKTGNIEYLFERYAMYNVNIE